ncbi:uncharacterized protein J4E88_003770 [Alternaria novae-zelandiae]|uniref:uncharacterized protein n=1 Tax=Alternaria novae-zelandiae TaxID=430562 RepID=UPI0020C4B682|nr:uncharacterized protein J4E88_003770 [Alternaria novae-zelandiae]KAI4685933.1 hypothetical protein J4E88_003770 [Alternaria novae-zelandiae]
MSTPAPCSTPKTLAMDPNINKDTLTSEDDETLQKIENAMMDELDQVLRRLANTSPHKRRYFSPGALLLLVLYTLIHVVFIQPASSLLGRQFLIPIIFMVFIEVTSEAYLERIVGSYEKIVDRMRDLARLSLNMAHTCEKALQEAEAASDQTAAYRTTYFRTFHQKLNEMRLEYYQAYLDHYGTLIDYVELITKKAKTMPAPPKVKGAKRNCGNRIKNDNNALTESLENFAVALKQRQSTARLQIAVAEKIKDILDREGLLPEEIDRLVDEAEEDLERAQDASNVRTLSPGSSASNSIASPLPVVESIDSKLEKHFEDLDRWFQSVRDQPVVAEDN